MTVRRASLVHLSALLGAILLLGSQAQATENGAPTTPAGLNDFGAGMTPPPTPFGTLGVRAAYYSTNQLKDGDGRKVNNAFSLDVLSLGVAYIRMTDRQLFGARYGFAIVQPFFQMDARLKVDTPFGPLRFEKEVFRQADTQITPLILQWDISRNLFVNTSLQIQAPTGDYDKNRLISPGLNHWTVSPVLNATWISDGGFEVSSSQQLDINSRNHATDYRSGTEYRHEFAVGQHVGPWTVGLGGYYYQQISDDDAPNLQSGNRARVIAVGPAVSFFKPGLPPVWLHAYKEFGAENRSEGYNVALRVAYSF
ncbi:MULTISPECIES: transporter [unclassified Pseudomonas]|uniref:SphA family protein n=1 Tax=unclassified Pseudomonas TaxID=196821 RepID=UPI000485663A|nr:MULTISPECIES: transporter [unclassified Pseudomonas]MBV7565031.1 transporter [Pseudomonas sp. sia0905]